MCVFFFFSFELLLNEIVMDGCVHDDGMSDLGMFCVWIPCRTDITYYFGWNLMGMRMEFIQHCVIYVNA